MARTLFPREKEAVEVMSVGRRQVRWSRWGLRGGRCSGSGVAVRGEPMGFAGHGCGCERQREIEVHGKDPPGRVVAPPVVHRNVGENSGLTWELGTYYVHEPILLCHRTHLPDEAEEGGGLNVPPPAPRPAHSVMVGASCSDHRRVVKSQPLRPGRGSQSTSLGGMMIGTVFLLQLSWDPIRNSANVC